MEAFILAAGYGTRMKPLTDFIPKALINIGDQALLQILINKLIANGFHHIVINTHYLKEQIDNFVQKNSFDADIFISEEDILMDTGGGLKNAQKLFSGNYPILIHNVDVISNLNLREIYNYHISLPESIATVTVSKRKTSRYFLFDKELNLKGWKNKNTNEFKFTANRQTDLQELAFSGIHVVSPDIFNYLPDEKIFSIIDGYLDIAKTKTIKGYIHSLSDWLDVGKPEMIQVAENFLFNSKA